MKIQKTTLYLLVLVLGFSLIVVALGGGLFGQHAPWYLQWQHKVFTSLCHQIPARSFTLNGQPMAVCSRCLGIYTGFVFGWILLPLSSFISFKEQWTVKKIALLVLLINLIDIIGNNLGFWQNTLVSRLAFGCMMGASVALIFSGDFFIRTLKSMEHYHGTTRATDV